MGGTQYMLAVITCCIQNQVALLLEFQISNGPRNKSWKGEKKNVVAYIAEVSVKWVNEWMNEWHMFAKGKIYLIYVKYQWMTEIRKSTEIQRG